MPIACFSVAVFRDEHVPISNLGVAVQVTQREASDEDTIAVFHRKGVSVAVAAGAWLSGPFLDPNAAELGDKRVITAGPGVSVQAAFRKACHIDTTAAANRNTASFFCTARPELPRPLLDAIGAALGDEDVPSTGVCVSIQAALRIAGDMDTTAGLDRDVKSKVVVAGALLPRPLLDAIAAEVFGH